MDNFIAEYGKYIVKAKIDVKEWRKFYELAMEQYYKLLCNKKPNKLHFMIRIITYIIIQRLYNYYRYHV